MKKILTTAAFLSLYQFAVAQPTNATNTNDQKNTTPTISAIDAISYNLELEEKRLKDNDNTYLPGNSKHVSQPIFKKETTKTTEKIIEKTRPSAYTEIIKETVKNTKETKEVIKKETTVQKEEKKIVKTNNNKINDKNVGTTKKILKKSQLKKTSVKKAKNPVKVKTKELLLTEKTVNHKVEEISFTKVAIPLKISFEDVILSANYNKENSLFSYSLYRKDGYPLQPNDFSESTHIQYYIVNSNLSSIEQYSLSVEQLIDNNNSSSFTTIGKCQAIYLRYHMAGDHHFVTQPFLLDSMGNITTQFDNACPKPQIDSKERVFYSKGNHIVSLHNAEAYYHTGKDMKLKAIVNYEGKEIIPSQLQLYAVSRDFTHFYTFDKKDLKNPYYGIDFTSRIDYSSNYYLYMKFVDSNQYYHFLYEERVE